MKVLVSGSSGLIGRALVHRLREEEHEVFRLVRGKTQAAEGEIRWDPATSSLNTARLENFDAVVHLAGKSVAAGRWTPALKEEIRSSRVQGTRFLCESLRQLARPPRVLVSASATGFYGDRGEEELVEFSGAGKGYLAEVARAWEQATAPAVEKGIRVVQARFSMVLSGRGGALKSMLLPFRLGLGGPIGSGRQYWSWIALDDAVSALCHALRTELLSGPVNIVSPCPVTCGEFARTLGRVLERPALLPLPAFAARLVLGEMADDLLLASARVLPSRLRDSGFAFAYPELEGALRYVLEK